MTSTTPEISQQRYLRLQTDGLEMKQVIVIAKHHVASAQFVKMSNMMANEVLLLEKEHR